jgi:hypothetical protein
VRQKDVFQGFSATFHQVSIRTIQMQKYAIKRTEFVLWAPAGAVVLWAPAGAVVLWAPKGAGVLWAPTGAGVLWAHRWANELLSHYWALQGSTQRDFFGLQC